MYQFDSDNRQVSSAFSESKVVALPLPSQAQEGVSEVLTEERLSVVETLPTNCTVDTEKIVTQLVSDRQLEQFISNLLKYGVLVASAIVFAGGVLYLILYGTEPADYRFFQGEPSELCSPVGVVKEVLSGSDRGIIQLGLLILIATPIARVAFSFFAFLRQREFAYIIITLFVLAGLIYSFIGAYV